MEFIVHTLSWCRGEILQGKIITLCAIAFLATSVSFFKFGTTPFARAMVLPVLVAGMLTMSVGVTLIFSNVQRIEDFQQRYSENPAAFAASENKRTEAFISWYPVTMKIIGVLLVLAMAAYLSFPTPYGRAISLSVMMLAIAALFIDHFSQERAQIYSEAIKEALDSQ